ncbi:uncharacterized protein EI90DRAFT_1021947 [Cantharellus anzutake]|uniref:uncharacterized protein n=1 Tax=Cantharellus anzutake TaxID=1750568 RepID=UPI0019071B27|nr:uncharacterized protein EI90DRAFT_1021947 [Cantharellus anzutake]KAF8331442.1 hypothetical protein EI90DRAFT_1021947 [Cantharellus anzutake]
MEVRCVMCGCGFASETSLIRKTISGVHMPLNHSADEASPAHNDLSPEAVLIQRAIHQPWVLGWFRTGIRYSGRVTCGALECIARSGDTPGNQHRSYASLDTVYLYNSSRHARMCCEGNTGMTYRIYVCMRMRRRRIGSVVFGEQFPSSIAHAFSPLWILLWAHHMCTQLYAACLLYLTYDLLQLPLLMMTEPNATLLPDPFQPPSNILILRPDRMINEGLYRRRRH